jgi:hypothetical protein
MQALDQQQNRKQSCAFDALPAVRPIHHFLHIYTRAIRLQIAYRAGYSTAHGVQPAHHPGDQIQPALKQALAPK